MIVFPTQIARDAIPPSVRSATLVTQSAELSANLFVEMARSSGSRNAMTTTPIIKTDAPAHVRSSRAINVIFNPKAFQYAI